MKINGKTILVCNCEGTMSLDGAALTKACGGEGDLTVHNHLCRTQMERFEAALGSGEPLIVACTQEAPLFTEVAAETAKATAKETALGFVNIRERAGWSEDAAAAATTISAKIAALLVESAMDLKPSPTVSMTSNGDCLIYGPGELAIPLAEQVADRLSVTLLVSDDEAVTPPTVSRVPMFRGSIIRAAGHLGAFTVTVANQATASASSRDRLDFDEGKKETEITCDLILDLTGAAPLFPGAEKRDGYVRPDPGNPAAVQKALFELTALVGEFEKPRYVAYDIDLCAHSRSTITGCSQCLDICPTSAIQSSGDGVVFDPFVCAGCGQCASVCPSGAVRYAMPSAEDSLQRLRGLLTAYFKAGGERPVLLLHDIRHGEPMIAMMARHGRGLPAPVLPFAFNEITQIGLDFLTAALAYGAGRIFIMLPPDKRDERAGLDQQIAVADALMAGLGLGEGRMTVIDEDDPARIEALLYDAPPRDSAARASFLPLGGKRTVMTLALGDLHAAAEAPPEVVSLPAGAPFGRIVVDTEGCTLCLACVGACPLSAIRDNPESPELNFTEQNCVQCGLCQKTCPEHVISLEPRYNFASEARDPVVLHSEEPFECVRCGTPFGVKSAIERIVEQLAGKHSMFQGEAGADLIKMCDNCRVNVQFEDGAFNQGTPRPTMRTTDDDLREREERRARGEPEDEDL